MNQTTTGTTQGFPKIKNVFAISKKKNDAKSSRLSKSVMLFGSIFMLALQLFSGAANAVNIPVTAFTCTQTMTATTTCVGVGDFASGWQTGAGFWQYNLNTVGYTGAITMKFSNTKSSAAGPTSGQVYYNIGAGDVAVTGGAFAVTTSCVAQTITLPAVCSGVSNLIVKVKMLGATASTATHRISSQNVFDAASSSCTTAPNAGTVTATTNPLCGGSSTVLSLTGASAGTGITYQWQMSPDNATWTNITGATGLSFTTPALTASTYYRVVTTCSGFITPSTSPSLLITVNNVTIAPITGLTTPVIVGDTQVLSDATGGGLWLTSAPSVASIDGSGNLIGLFGGNTVISYQVTDPTSGCVGSVNASVNVVWPNTLALYAGTNGNSTNVIPVPGDNVGTLYHVGFGAATACTSGGFSGMTVNVADSVIDLTGDSAHIGYKVYPAAGKALNLYRIHANARVSGTGPTKARIGYQFWSNGAPSGWSFEFADVALVTGSCGSSLNAWDFNTGIPANPNPTQNGITDSLEVAVFPFAPGASTGTFQLNSLEVYGIVTSDSACNGGSIVTSADSVLPALSNICDSGSRFLTYNVGSGGIAGVGIEYQWQVSTNNSSWSDITDANGIVYQTPELNGSSSPSDTLYYRVAVTCDFSGTTTFSEVAVVTIHPTPANAGTISGALAASASLPYDHMLFGTAYTLASTVTGGTWSSNDTSVLSIDPLTGVSSPNLQGDAVVTYHTTVGGCTGTSKDTVVVYHPNTKALYVGRNGSTTNVYAEAGASTATALTLTNWGSATGCSNGGVSGLTNTTTVQDQTTNGEAVTRVAAATGTFNASAIRATVRGQNSGTYMTYVGYRAVGGSTWTTSTPVSVEFDDCGYSHNEVVYSFPSAISVGTTGVDFALFGYNGTATTTLQMNSLSVIGDGPSLMNGVYNVATSVQVYPNPVENTLIVSASQNVNVVIMSIDGKKLLEQNNAKSINVSSLMSGMYLIQVYSQDNKTLLKTDKFIKK